ncbi:hypothetical protein IFM89_028311 [Coptis chinensis]|uniref:Nitrate regulatory gene2 protein n=1 Tax=Coptis chinensis TaxID=261450 RepID=A0A835I5V0_9MAGN|nr:hypothetical protein IFM89_028311 [Coptis chinensis]
MGCGGSKVDDLPLVTLCRERKELIKAAGDHRYALAASHMAYFRSLKDVGDALRRFVDEEIVMRDNEGSTFGSPVLTLPSDEGKKKKKSNGSSSSTSLTHSVTFSHGHSPDHDHDDNDDGSHLHFVASGSEADSGSVSDHIHGNGNGNGNDNDNSSGHIHDSSEGDFSHYENGFSPSKVNSYSFYMKRSSTAIPTVIYEDPRVSSPTRTAQWTDYPYSSVPQYGGGMGEEYQYSSYPQYGGRGGYFEAPTSSGSPRNMYYNHYRESENNRPPSPAVPPSPPPPPQYSTWDFLNPFESVENTYSSYYPEGRYGVGSISSSPDSVEVRQREGIPDLEDEIKQVPARDVRKQKQKLEENVRGDFGEGTSGNGPSRSVPSPDKDNFKPVEEKEIKSSSTESIVSVSTGEEELTTKKGVSFEVGGETAHDGESSKPSSLTTLSAHGTRDLQEVVKEIRDEFEIASDYGKEVAVILEVGKLPYLPRTTALKVIFSRIQNLVAPPTLTSINASSRRSKYAAFSATKMSKVGYEDFGDFRRKSGNLSSTLDRLYAWERKLYKEVKDEEKLRVIYEKKCKRLKSLDAKGADPNKIDATHTSIWKLDAKIDVAFRTVDGIASKIHKLRDEELQPQITELINGLIRMWKFVLKCHQKQFQAIIESKSCTLMANTASQRGSSLRATVELELELLKWCTNFSNWIDTQKAYVESLNGWLLRCLLQEPEVTADGIVPFSPGRVGAPPIFVVCNDWYHAIERLAETEVETSIHDFALSLHQLWERQDEEQRQRLKAEYLVKDFEKRLRTLRREQVKIQRDRDASSEKSAMSVVPNESGVSPLDDLKVDLDSMRKRLEEEKAKHKEAVQQVHEAASSSLQGGLIPIFESLRNFTSDTLKAYEHVRIQNTGGAT